MNPSTFTIIDASAGSGKTFALTKAYLKILLLEKNPDAFRQILAITFTNKAVGEMKTRIVESLKEFASVEIFEKEHPMLNALLQETKLTTASIHEKSKSCLKHILHNYGGFEISTIDSFIYRIIKSFARELNVPFNFEVELDQDQMLTKAVDALIANADTKDKITPVLVQFAIEKSDEDKSYDIARDLKLIADLLTQENDLVHLSNLKDKEIEDFNSWKRLISSKIESLTKEIQASGTKAFQLISDHGLSPKDFLASIGTYFSNIQNGNFNVSFDRVWQQKLESGEDIFLKKTPPAKQNTISQIQDELDRIFQESKVLIFELLLEKALYKNLVPLSLLKALERSLHQLKEDEKKILISEFNTIVNNEIKNQPAPYIFERLGEKIRHFFIDEFQDTSIAQWNNLIPLLHHSLSSEHNSTTIVGDPKQAIYRWRGGDASQFIDLINGKSNPFHIDAIKKRLEFNYRSSKTIVDFNNQFFDHIAEFALSNPDHSKLFKSSGQKIINQRTGFVKFNFHDFEDEEEKRSLYNSSINMIINDCLTRGYNLKDICVLVRKHKHGVIIAEELGKSNIPITSSEALLIKNSPKVQLLLSLFELQVSPQDLVLKAGLLYQISDLLKIAHKHTFIDEHLHKSLEDILNSAFNAPKNFINKTLSFYENLELYIQLLKFDDSSDAFLQFFMDLVLEHSIKGDGDITSFIDYFQQNEDKLSISSPEGRNAVSIMTIHKAKGLEFPIVIFPYAEVNIYEDRNSHIWAPIDSNNNAGFQEAMFNVSSKMEYYGPEIKELYQEHMSNLELDHINLLYVALTRAKNELHIVCKKDTGSNGPNLKSFAGLFISYLQKVDLWDDSKQQYEIGEKTIAEEKSKPSVSSSSLPLNSTSRNKHFKVITSSGQLWDSKIEAAANYGKLVHYILSKIKYASDIEFALSSVHSEGIMTTDELPLYRSLVNSICNHPQLKTYFSTDFDIRTEFDLINPDGSMDRPDRMCVSPNNKTTIIDYKTGGRNPAHFHQMHRYISSVRRMGHINVRGLLIYTNDPIELVEI